MRLPIGYALVAAAAWSVIYGLWFGLIRRDIRGFGGVFTGSDAVARGMAGIVVGLLMGAFVVAMMIQGRW